MTLLIKKSILLLSLLALNVFANDTMVSQMANGFFSSFFSFFIPIVVLGAILSIGLSLAQKKPEMLAYGCGTIFLLAIVGGIIITIVDFIKAHSTAFIVGGIILVLAILICCFIFKPNPKEIELQKRANEIKQRRTSSFKKEELRIHPATYENVVGTMPTAAEIAGKMGEDAVSKAVWSACQFDGRHYKILRNVYVPIHGKYSETDVLLLHETGIYVFESKNLSGSIYGDDDHSQWQRYKTNGEKDFIPNPIKQNDGHINALCSFLKQNKYQFRAFSMIVFGTKANLKYVPEDKSLVTIHEVYNLEMDLVKKMKSEKNFYSAETIDSWCNKLLPYTQLTEEEKASHKERLSQRFKRVN